MIDNLVPKLGEFKYPYPKNKPTKIDTTEDGCIIELEGLDRKWQEQPSKSISKKFKKKYNKVFYTNFIHSEFIRDILLKN